MHTGCSWAGCAPCTWATSRCQPRLSRGACATLQFCVSESLLPSCARLGGVGEAGSNKSASGSCKRLEGWPFSLETRAHLERTSLRGRGRPCPHTGALSALLALELRRQPLPPWSSGSRCAAFPQLPVCIRSPARAHTRTCSAPPPHPPLWPFTPTTPHLRQMLKAVPSLAPGPP